MILLYFKVEKEVNDFMKDLTKKHFKYPPMEKIERSIMYVKKYIIFVFVENSVFYINYW